MIKGIHHVSIKCENEEMYKKVIDFYCQTLEMKLLRSWGEKEKSGCMIDTGCGIIELFATGLENDCTGIINHIALACDDVAGCLEKCRQLGLQVMVEAKDIVINAQTPYPATIGFAKGMAGEVIEFFCER